MNLTDIKRETSEELWELLEEVKNAGFTHQRLATASFLNAFADRLLEEVEKAVVPECTDLNCDGAGTIAHQVAENDWEPEPCQFCHQIRIPTSEAFAKFRGV